MGHAQQWRDADSACQQNRMRSIWVQRKIVARQPYFQQLAFRKRVHEPRTAARIRFQLNRDSVGAVIGGGVDQRILPDQFAGMHVDMSARFERLKSFAIGAYKLDRADIFGFDANPPDKGILRSQSMPF